MGAGAARRLTNRPCHDKDMMRLLGDAIGETASAFLNAATGREIPVSIEPESQAAPAAPTPDRWGAFSHAAFTAIWTASVVSNLGTAVFDTASGRMITSLN